MRQKFHPPLRGRWNFPPHKRPVELYEISSVHPAQVSLRRCAVRLAALASRPGCGRTLRLGPGQRPTVPRSAGRPGGGANPKFVPWAARPEIGRSRRRGGAWRDPIYGASEQAMSWQVVISAGFALAVRSSRGRLGSPQQTVFVTRQCENRSQASSWMSVITMCAKRTRPPIVVTEQCENDSTSTNPRVSQRQRQNRGEFISGYELFGGWVQTTSRRSGFGVHIQVSQILVGVMFFTFSKFRFRADFGVPQHLGTLQI